MLIFKMKNYISGYYSIIFISVEFVINTNQDGKDYSFKNLIFLPRCFPKGTNNNFFFLSGTLLPVFILCFISE